MFITVYTGLYIWGFPKSWGYPQIVHFNQIVHYEPSIFWEIPMTMGSPISNHSINIIPFLSFHVPSISIFHLGHMDVGQNGRHRGPQMLV